MIKLKIIHKINLRRYKPYRDCDEILAKKFFKALDTGDYRHILKTDNLPEYPVEKLAPIWDGLISEYDKLTGGYSFVTQLIDIRFNLIDHNKIMLMNACYNLMLLGQDNAVKYLQEQGINITGNTYNEQMRLRSMILMEQTKLNIRAERDKSTPQTKKTTFIESLVDLENALNGKNIDEDKITLAKWVANVNSANNKIKALKNGKSNKR